MQPDRMNYYQDSKEFPLWNYKRCLQSGSFFYIIKGYEGGDIDADAAECEAKFYELVKDYAFSLNAVNADIVNYGAIEQAKMKILLLSVPLQMIELHNRKNKLRTEIGLEPENNEIITQLLEGVKITKSDDLQRQSEILKDKIEKLQNEINEAVKKLEKNQPEAPQEPADIDEIIINVALILEYQIDERKTSLYQFGILQKQARNKIEQIANLNAKNI